MPFSASAFCPECGLGDIEIVVEVPIVGTLAGRIFQPLEINGL